jgi:hypothetical protein
MGLAGSLAVTVLPANASTTVAEGCTSGRYIAPPATHFNGGTSSCVTLNHGWRVRTAVHCRNAFGSYWTYGKWIYLANYSSKAVCNSLQEDAYEVMPQTAPAP